MRREGESEESRRAQTGALRRTGADVLAEHASLGELVTGDVRYEPAFAHRVVHWCIVAYYVLLLMGLVSSHVLTEHSFQSSRPFLE